MADLSNLEARIAQLEARLADSARAQATTQDSIARASTIARDTVLTLVNGKRVAENGRLGAVGLANTLSDAPVGDPVALRNNMGLTSAATTQVFPTKTATAVGPRDDALPTSKQLWEGVEAAKEYTRSTGVGSGSLPFAGDIRAKRTTGFYFWSPDSANRYTDYGLLLHIQHNGPDWRTLLHFPTGGDAPRYDSLTNNGWSRTGCTFLIEGINAVVDGSGFYKKSSPIYKLCDPTTFDTANEYFTVAGYGAGNADAEGVSAERIAVGHYVVRGALGFAGEGWTIEAPRDKNNQPLVWLDTSQDKAGVITIKTYHRTYPDAPPFARNYIEGVNEADPIDIPQGRQIDLRLEMPAKPRS